MSRLVRYIKYRKILLLLSSVILVTLSSVANATIESQAELRNDNLIKKLKNQCGDWEGVISVIVREKHGNEQREYPASLTMHQIPAAQDTPQIFEGVLTIKQDGSGSSSKEVCLSLAFNVGNTGGQGTIGDNSTSFTNAHAPESCDLIDRERTLWIGGNNRLEIQVTGDTGMDLIISGIIDLPETLTTGPVVWLSGHLRREGFRITLGSLFEITLMECLGIFATLFFASRFLIQLVASERAGRSVVPEIFWWVSLFGGLSMMIYAVYFGRFAVLLGQLTGWCVYLRNIWLIHREKARLRNDEGGSAVMVSDFK